MQRQGEIGVPGRNSHDRAQGDRGKVTATIRRLLHGADRGIRVIRDDDAVARRDMKIAEQVALGQGGDEQLFRVPPVLIAMEDPIRRTGDVVLALRAHNMVAPVCPVVARSSAPVSGPFERDGEAVFVIHTANATPCNDKI